MNLPNSTPRDVTIAATLTFEAIFKNSLGQEIAGIWFIGSAWQISTEPLLRFATKAEALEAWENRFDHQSGLPR